MAILSERGVFFQAFCALFDSDTIADACSSVASTPLATTEPEKGEIMSNI
jgi:hypothetical protein